MRRVSPLVVFPVLVCCHRDPDPGSAAAQESVDSPDGCPRLYGEVDMLPNSCETVPWSRVPNWTVPKRSEQLHYSILGASGTTSVERISYRPGGPLTHSSLVYPDLPKIGFSVPSDARRLVLDLPGYDGRLWLGCATDASPAVGGVELFEPGSPRAMDVNAAWTQEEGGTARLKLPKARALVGPGVVAATADIAAPRGGDLQVRAPGGPGWVTKADGSTSPWHRYILISGDCGRVDVEADPALFLDAAFRSTGFDLRIGWGLADVELVPGSVLETDSQVQADGAIRLTLPASVAATVQVPAGWPVFCYQVDNPACDKVGPLDLRTTPAGGPSITLQAPVGLVELVADPWPADLPCPVSDPLPFVTDVPDPRSALGQLARGELAPAALRRRPGIQLATGQHDLCLTGPSQSLVISTTSGDDAEPAHDVTRNVTGMPAWPIP